MWLCALFYVLMLREATSQREERDFSSESNIQLLVPLSISVDREDRSSSASSEELPRSEPFSNIPSYAFTLDEGTPQQRSTVLPQVIDNRLLYIAQLWPQSAEEREPVAPLWPQAVLKRKPVAHLWPQTKQKQEPVAQLWPKTEQKREPVTQLWPQTEQKRKPVEQLWPQTDKKKEPVTDRHAAGLQACHELAERKEGGAREVLLYLCTELVELLSPGCACCDQRAARPVPLFRPIIGRRDHSFDDGPKQRVFV